MKNVDLHKLRDEIDNRKNNKNMVSSRLGENVGRNVPVKDEFLNGLLTSLNTGKETASTQLIKVVENKVAEKNKETPRHKTVSIPEQSKETVINENYDNSPERDELLWREFENRKKQTLAESMSNYINPTQHGNMQNVGTHNTSQQINEGYLVENVKKIVNNYLTENFTILLEEAIKNVVIEMYAVERIKSVLGENKEIIRGEILGVIKEIQAKTKAKAQQ